MNQLFIKLVVFIGTFILTLPVLLWTHKYRQMVLDSDINAWINLIFVQGYGYLWFTAITAAAAPYNRIAMKWYAVATIWVILVTRWCFGPALFERMDVWAGGWCEDGAVGGTKGIEVGATVTAITARACSKWVSKFDASGHYFLITSMSMNTDWPVGAGGTVGGSGGAVGGGYGSGIMGRKWVQASLLLVMIVLLAVWYAEFVVTSLFFHTAAERAVGLVFGVPWWRIWLQTRPKRLPLSSQNLV